MFPLERMRMIPLYSVGATKVATSARVAHYGGDFSVFAMVGYTGTDATVQGSTAAGYSDTSANYVTEFTVLESTAASAAGTAITGATLSLGCATACVNRGVAMGGFTFTSALTTLLEMVVNGITFHATATETDGEKTATQVAAIMNGKGTWSSIPHYEAIANYPTTGCVWLQPIDDMATGLTLQTTAVDSTVLKGISGLVQGCININAGKLSTTSPKYISVSVSETTASIPKSVFYVTGGAFQGAVVNVTTP